MFQSLPPGKWLLKAVNEEERKERPQQHKERLNTQKEVSIGGEMGVPSKSYKRERKKMNEGKGEGGY